MMWKVLIPDAVDTACDAILEKGGASVTRLDRPTEEELLDIVGDYDAMVVRSAVRVTPAMIDRMTRMKVIGRAGAGVDNIDIAAATRAGILVMNTPGGNTISAAEHTIALLLSMLRQVPAADHSMKEGEWNRKKFSGTELYGKTVGIVGLGKIGREILARLLPFEIVPLGFDPVLGDVGITGLGAEPVTFEEMIARADILTFHVPLNDQTRGMVGEAELAKMKPGVRIVNCARGGVVDEKALADAIQSGHVAGAALDVYSSEPPEQGNRLPGLSATVTTPHIAASTGEAQHRVAVAIAEGILGLLGGQEISGLVNAGDIAPAFSRGEEAPYRLARAMGDLLRGMFPTSDLQIGLTVYNNGEPSSRSGLVATLLGSLFSGSDRKVTPLNASVIADESEVAAAVTSELEGSRHTTYLRAEVTGPEPAGSVALSLSSAGEPRIVELNGRDLDFDPYGEIILLDHIDRPGMMASISAILSQAQINIADLSLGRKESSTAMTLIRTDEPVGESIMAEIGQIEGINSARAYSIRRSS